MTQPNPTRLDGVYMGAHIQSKRRNKGESGRKATQTCTKPTPDHNLEILIRGHVPRCALTLNDMPERVYTDALKWPAWMSWHGRPQMTHPNEFTWEPTWVKRRHKGEPRKRVARTCTNPTSGHNLAFLIWARFPRRALARPAQMSLHGHPHPTRLNELTQTPSNDPPEWVYMGAHMTVIVMPLGLQ